MLHVPQEHNHCVVHDPQGCEHATAHSGPQRAISVGLDVVQQNHWLERNAVGGLQMQKVVQDCTKVPLQGFWNQHQSKT